MINFVLYNKGLTLLHAIAGYMDYGEHAELFEECFKQSKHHINTKTNEGTGKNCNALPIELAVRMGYAKTVKYLFDHGADIHTTDHLGFHLIHLVVNSESGEKFKSETSAEGKLISERPEIIKVLLEQGADINAIYKRNGWTALHYAASDSRPSALEIVKYLVEMGADVNAKNEQDFTPIMTAAWANTSDFDMFKSVWGVRVDILNYLIEKGADTDYKTRKGSSLLTLCKAHNEENMFDEIIKKLEDKSEKDQLDTMIKLEDKEEEIISNKKE